MLPHLPVLGVCGFSNSGKTTLLERTIPSLVRKNLRVAVVKHDAHRIDVDRPGKDSDRLFKAGADVVLHGDQRLCRLHSTSAHTLERTVTSLCREYDIVLVEGYKHSPLPKIWLCDADNSPPPTEMTGLLDIFAWDIDRPARLLAFLDGWLQEKYAQRPLFGLILLGGKSSRMGEAKQLLPMGGRTWMEQIAATLQPFVRRTLVAGDGELPPSLAGLARLPDCPDCRGPLAGMLSALRWEPDVLWLMVACDMPLVSAEALSWLLERRSPGVWGVLPHLQKNLPEPLFALYDGRFLESMENLARQPEPRPGLLAAHPKMSCVEVPKALQRAWTNINSPEELRACPELRLC